MHHEELHNFCSLPSIIRMAKSRRMRWIWHVAQMGKKRNSYRLFIGMPERGCYESQDMGGWIILRWILER
jgi:hypothetical protein